MTNWIEILHDFKQNRQAVALVMVTKCLGSAPCKVGSRMIVTTAKDIYGTIGGGKLEFQVIDEAILAIEKNTIVEKTYTLGPEFEQCCGGKVELIIEPMNQSPELFIFGAGHIGVELCQLMINTPFSVHLIDSRENWFSSITLHKEINTCTVSEKDFATFTNAVHWGKNCYVLVMTHDHGIDFDIIAAAIPKETKYLGLIGSKTKKVRFNNMLINEMSIDEGMTNVVCPIGLETGGNTPKEIAISIAAQLLQIHYNK